MTNIDTPKHLEPEDRDSPIPGGQNARGSATQLLRRYDRH